MKHALLKKVMILMVVLSLSVIAALALAADKQWVVIKDSKGVCKVIEASGKTAKTIAGPFKTKDEALKEKAKVCPKDTKEKEKEKKK